MRVILLTVCAASLLTAACGDGEGVRITSTSTRTDGENRGPLKVVDALQCPETMGPLTRKGTAQAEGSVCVYSGPRGAEVSLHLVRLDGEPAEDVLKTFETRLTGDLPSAAEAMNRAAAEDNAAVKVEAEGERAHVRAPGLNIEADGDKANVRLGPISIRADGGEGDSGTVDINSGGDQVSVQAHGNSAEVRTRASGDGIRATWLLSDNRRSTDGWRAVGYQARGPEGGPIVIATMRTRDRDSDRIFDAAGDLVKLNVGE